MYCNMWFPSPDQANGRTLRCEVGNPLPANSRSTVRIFLRPSEDGQDRLLTEYDFYLATNSSNQEEGTDSQDNERLIRIPLSVSSDWRVTGTSRPEFVEYNISQELPAR